MLTFCFQHAYLMAMPSGIWTTTKVKIANIYVFIYRNVLVDMKINKIEFYCKLCRIILSFRET